jgi:hypothetical protein
MQYVQRLMLFAVVVFSLVSLVLAQDPEPAQRDGRGGRGGRGRGGDGGAQGFFQPGGPSFALRDALDKDRDGKLSADEVKAATESL